MATSQHRCVFVGNIPYDATEEQLIQICEEVGPVVSFRLVIDRETGKPKGYGFCEYKDEETALSARRNLQGYEINGRQLRVDFAENDKGADRNREQGRGGPGMTVNVDPPKQVGGPAILGDPGVLQPVGLSLAMTAATVMAGALGGAQAGGRSNVNGLHGQLASGTDTLTLHLAKMSRHQLNEIMSELKVMATQNKEQAHQLLTANPQLRKALFQIQIMLGMVSPQMLQMPNIRAASDSHGQPWQDSQQVQQPAIQTLSGLPPLAQSKMQFGLMPKVQEGQVSSMPPNSFIHNQYSALPHRPAQPQIQLPQQAQSQTVEQGALSGKPGVSTFPSRHPQPLNGVSIRPQVQVASSSFMPQQIQPSLSQHRGQVGHSNLGHNNQLVAPNGTPQHPLLTRAPLSDQPFQPSSSVLSSTPVMMNKNAEKPPEVSNDTAWAQRVGTHSSLPTVSSQRANMAHNTSGPSNRPSKLLKLDDGRGNTFSAVGLNASTSVPGPSQVSGNSISGNQIPKAEEAQSCDKQLQQSQLPPDVESALLQQVLNLTPEQLSSLPPDQQQQVLQLQQMLR